jgi:hypothetical protein
VTVPCHASWAALLALPILTGHPPAPDRCSLSGLHDNAEGYQYRLEQIQRLVADADVIARVTTIDAKPLPTLRGEPESWQIYAIGFRVDELLRGPDSLGRIELPGWFVDRDDFNRGAVPYRMVRSAGQRGDCYAREYRRGASYLLLLKTDTTGYDLSWGPLAPVNEQLRGADDPWFRWVREEMERGSGAP